LGFFKRLTRPRATLGLRVEKNELVLGEDLKGVVLVRSEEEFDVGNITFALLCLESVKKQKGHYETNDDTGKREWREEEYWDTAVLFSKRLELCAEAHITVGFSREIPLTARLPAIGRETYHGVDRNLKWIAEIRMNPKGRRHIGYLAEIFVAKSPSLLKEVVREVVLVPCAYCGGLMPQTATFCPNCGARRRA